LSNILDIQQLGFPWVTSDPFLFCAYHDDAYPQGNERLGPVASLKGRHIGMDFEVRDGWRMYHGEVVPGFPQHPHRGFETVTLARQGFIDHSDSLGAKARFGQGDVQWMTAGKGISHSEMFPLLQPDRPNPVELFQIWLNLPRADKMVAPHFAMLWGDRIPRHAFHDDAGRVTEVVTIAGALKGQACPKPPPHSWAAREASEVAIWTIRMEAKARWTVPKASPGLNRTLYYFLGDGVTVDGRDIPDKHAVRVRSETDVVIEAGPREVELLMLQGRPIAEPVAHSGPFVMNTRDELMQAYSDYRRTRFGGWPHKSDEPVHARDAGRFARHADGRVEKA
jgi:redox-sensitive bicupin YhaK (pirin superfamily)